MCRVRDSVFKVCTLSLCSLCVYRGGLESLGHKLLIFEGAWQGSVPLSGTLDIFRVNMKSKWIQRQAFYAMVCSLTNSTIWQTPPQTPPVKLHGENVPWAGKGKPWCQDPQYPWLLVEANTTLKSMGQGLLYDTAGKIKVRILTLRKLHSS